MYWGDNEKNFYTSIEGRNSMELMISTMQRIYTLIENNVPYIELAEKYATDNIAYVLYISGDGFPNAAWYAVGYPGLVDGYDIEKDYHENARVYNWYPVHSLTHEIMHLFGAPDLYAGSEFEGNGITAELLDYAKAKYPYDVMISTANEDTYDLLEISPLTAYRIGWIDDIPELRMFPNFRNPADIAGIVAPYTFVP